MDVSDAQLLGRTAGGERTAFDQLVLRYQAIVYRFARAATRTPEQAEDVLQETFLAAFRSAATYRGEASVKSWLLSIARNKVHRLGRPRAGQPDQFESLDKLGQRAGWGAENDPEAAAMDGERRIQMAAAMGQLRPEDREVLVLRDLEGLPGESVAAMLGIGLAAMKSRLHRARLRFAARLREGGGDPDGP